MLAKIIKQELTISYMEVRFRRVPIQPVSANPAALPEMPYKSLLV
jgi:hypothetical protein